MLTQDYSPNSVFCENITTMDTARHCVRRSALPHKEAEFSSQSIMKAMEKFVAAVQEMEETILMPSRLMDLEVGDSADTVGHRDLGSTDLYRLYATVNTAKKELLWGGREEKGHARRPSTVSTGSSGLSDTESEAGTDSGLEAEPEAAVLRLEQEFRRHLGGLQRSLGRLTEAAAYLTKRYQNDIGGL